MGRGGVSNEAEKPSRMKYILIPLFSLVSRTTKAKKKVAL